MIKIAVDAMGGDHAPQAIVEGALAAVQTYSDIQILLYGDQAQIQALLPKGDYPIEIIHCSEKIAGDDEPVRAIRRKKDASMVVAAKAVKKGQADALVSAGNTGALLAAGTLLVGRIKGIDRPALLGTLPNLRESGESFVLVDMGANADAKAKQLWENALMGNQYAKDVLGKSQPRVGLLNNGSEDSKGNKVTKEAFELLSQEEQIHFIGNVESRDILAGVCDVVVSDGFTGNAVLKAIEGTAKEILTLVSHSLKSGNLQTKLGALLIKNSLKETLGQFDIESVGGATLFGVKAPVIKCHGNASAKTVAATIGQARQIVKSGTYDSLAQQIANKEGQAED
ncbi:phosphate acyltransferase PlsX [Aerococcus urinae]|uniref:Phosphate acyltransferase n=1 Tax=Aerococcus mictus TaxID=2976810 RepID=A0A1E9PQ10_9LACT|nr:MULTISPECIES: phosphate acyltransferase PlsX [Aerococcus]KAA9293575.1 phosphate acyltransferase PlsX [Aerococcus mictus]MBU5609878.1 phosphate acyltransferase PlsX [Aerococcus urinae]MCY3033839.1 phosphate acyltransferase PlsX [Aerococcus mictus]MCY3063128.1 phosphate acyltransferase PlsX [Aerococcus mictus]MCY3065143.1 phosphate acyltransferase PlsX [Aerococcus mictus]